MPAVDFWDILVALLGEAVQRLVWTTLLWVCSMSSNSWARPHLTKDLHIFQIARLLKFCIILLRLQGYFNFFLKQIAICFVTEKQSFRLLNEISRIEKTCISPIEAMAKPRFCILTANLRVPYPFYCLLTPQKLSYLVNNFLISDPKTPLMGLVFYEHFDYSVMVVQIDYSEASLQSVYLCSDGAQDCKHSPDQLSSFKSTICSPDNETVRLSLCRQGEIDRTGKQFWELPISCSLLFNTHMRLWILLLASDASYL